MDAVVHRRKSWTGSHRPGVNDDCRVGVRTLTCPLFLESLARKRTFRYDADRKELLRKDFFARRANGREQWRQRRLRLVLNVVHKASIWRPAVLQPELERKSHTTSSILDSRRTTLIQRRQALSVHCKVYVSSTSRVDLNSLDSSSATTRKQPIQPMVVPVIHPSASIHLQIHPH